MPTKPELEDRVDLLEILLSNVDEALLDLLIDVRGVHEYSHDEPWAVCRNAVCRTSQLVEGLRYEIARAAA